MVGNAVPGAVAVVQASELYPVMVLDVARCQLMRRLRPVEERNDGVYADASIPQPFDLTSHLRASTLTRYPTLFFTLTTRYADTAVLNETTADGAAVKRAVSFRAWEVNCRPHRGAPLSTPTHLSLQPICSSLHLLPHINAPSAPLRNLYTRGRCCGTRVTRILRSSGSAEDPTTCDRSPPPSSPSALTTPRAGKRRSGAPTRL